MEHILFIILLVMVGILGFGAIESSISSDDRLGIPQDSDPFAVNLKWNCPTCNKQRHRFQETCPCGFKREKDFYSINGAVGSTIDKKQAVKSIHFYTKCSRCGNREPVYEKLDK